MCAALLRCSRPSRPSTSRFRSRTPPRPPCTGSTQRFPFRRSTASTSKPLSTARRSSPTSGSRTCTTTSTASSSPASASSPSTARLAGQTWPTSPSRTASPPGGRSRCTATARRAAILRTSTTSWTASWARWGWRRRRRSSTWETTARKAFSTLLRCSSPSSASRPIARWSRWHRATCPRPMPTSATRESDWAIRRARPSRWASIVSSSGIARRALGPSLPKVENGRGQEVTFEKRRRGCGGWGPMCERRGVKFPKTRRENENVRNLETNVTR
mmetsp:Transcript_13797/g.44204  ORF Transcript_13797/g.44204 Transcript_13797/m.44204 type:complete len:273 (-) Transcript_13797:26-844(-)